MGIKNLQIRKMRLKASNGGMIRTEKLNGGTERVRNKDGWFDWESEMEERSEWERAMEELGEIRWFWVRVTLFDRVREMCECYCFFTLSLIKQKKLTFKTFYYWDIMARCEVHLDNFHNIYNIATAFCFVSGDIMARCKTFSLCIFHYCEYLNQI
jgi:hypothetical protein